MTENSQQNKQNGKIIWRCPSNIAIVKYWGKRDIQIPCNSSVSMTLSASYTEIELELFKKETNEVVELDYFFENKKNQLFENRVKKYLEEQSAYFPVLKNYCVQIHSVNSFPHSAGIASSASAFGALALALLDASFSKELHSDDFFQSVSKAARLGSGSACRSVFGGFALWGKTDNVPGSSNEFAIPIENIHENFKQLHDTILIVDENPKQVSSSAGHSLMNNHAYAKNRFEQANERASRIMQVLRDGNLEEFIKITESEALTLHAMMMTSDDYYLLMKPGTLIIIEQIIAFRKETAIPVCFTLDAGPNVHVIYPDTDKMKVEYFINNQLKDSVKRIIFDKSGNGPERLN